MPPLTLALLACGPSPAIERPFGPADDLEVPHLNAPATAHAIFTRLRGGPAGPLARLPGRQVTACSYGTEVVCGTGHGSSLDDAVQAIGALPEGLLKVDVVVASRPGPLHRREVGVLGPRTRSGVVPPSRLLELGLDLSAEDADPWSLAEGDPSDLVATVAWVEAAEGPLHLNRLHAEPPEPSAAVLRRRAVWAAEHLHRQVDPATGRFRYRWDPVSRTEPGGYNWLRHAGATMALLQAWERDPVPAWRAAAERALQALVAETRPRPPNGRDLVDGGKVKLGGPALALVALATWQRVTGEDHYADVASALARFLVSQQQPSGQFASYAPIEPGADVPERVSSYYPGEAVLALHLWSRLDSNPAWAGSATRGAAWLIEQRDGPKPDTHLLADQWLMLALAGLATVDADPRWLAHSQRLARAVEARRSRAEQHLAALPDYRGAVFDPPRGTPAAVRVEGVVATLEHCRTAGADCSWLEPVLRDLLHHLLRTQYLPGETWWTSPEPVLGAFAGGIVDPEVRVDYTQHALSGLLAAERWMGHDPTPIEDLRGPALEVLGPSPHSAPAR